MSGSNNEQVTVDRGTYELFSRASGLLDNLLKNPKTARDAERLVREINPNASFPASDLAESYLAPVRDALDATNKKLAETSENFAEYKKKQEEEAQIAAFTDRLNKAATKYGFDEKRREAVLKRMAEQNNPDLEAAAAYIYDAEPKPGPVNPKSADRYIPGPVDIYGVNSKDERWKDLHDNQDKFWRDVVDDVLANPPSLGAA
jgi:hypothetical protein